MLFTSVESSVTGTLRSNVNVETWASLHRFTRAKRRAARPTFCPERS
jgi:hypothetical protein